MVVVQELPPSKLRWSCGATVTGSQCAVSPPASLPAQERFTASLRVGVEMKAAGYNVFVTGLQGTRAMEVCSTLLRDLLDSLPPPVIFDQLFVHNFKVLHKQRLASADPSQTPNEPVYLAVPKGKGRELKRDMETLVESLKTNLPQILESESYQNQKKALSEQIKAKTTEMIQNFEKKGNSWC